MISSVGIIGLGSFGCLAAELIPKNVEVRGFSRRERPIPERIKRVSFNETVASDVVVLASPLEAMPELLQKMQPLLKPSTLVIDVCSVKVLPEQYFARFLPEHPNVLLTHPLFGPQSTTHGTEGCELVVTWQKGKLAHEVLEYCKNNLKLTLHTVNSKEHDKIMAQVHALTFYVARGLHQLHLQNTAFSTPSYKMLEQLIRFDQTHSDDLFQTIQCGNPYAPLFRQKLLDSFTEVDRALQQTKQS